MGPWLHGISCRTKVIAGAIRASEGALGCAWDNGFLNETSGGDADSMPGSAAGARLGRERDEIETCISTMP